jgi:iron complex transport system ATP-binding protein
VTPPALRMSAVEVRTDGVTILRGVDWLVDSSQHWVVLGPNGSGKTTLLRVASLYLHPSGGEVAVDGEALGRSDVRSLRARIGLASPAFGDLLRPQLTATEIVMTARHAALEPWWHQYDEDDRARAVALLQRFGVAQLADRPLITASSGERQRVLLARAFSGEPVIVLLDEPTAGLDLGGREDLVARLGAAPAGGPATVLVTHHVEEIPVNATHALLLRDGAVLGQGPIDDVVTEERLSATFGVPLKLERHGPRWSARAR